jgi:hypothetical protein
MAFLKFHGSQNLANLEPDEPGCLCFSSADVLCPVHSADFDASDPQWANPD